MILSLDWVDLAGTLKTACGGESSAKIIQVSLDHLLHGGWSMDYQGLPPVDLFIAAEPDAAVPVLLEALVPKQLATTTAIPVGALPPLTGMRLRRRARSRLRRAIMQHRRRAHRCRARVREKSFAPREYTFSAAPNNGGAIGTDDIAVALRAAVGDRPVSFSHLPLSWNGASWPFRHPLDFLGSDGGGGIGAGPGIAVGAALALKGRAGCRSRSAETATI